MLFHMYSIITNTACSFPSVVPFISSDFRHQMDDYDLWIFNRTQRKKKKNIKIFQYNKCQRIWNNVKLHYWNIFTYSIACESYVHMQTNCCFHKFVPSLKSLNNFSILIYSSKKKKVKSCYGYCFKYSICAILNSSYVIGYESTWHLSISSLDQSLFHFTVPSFHNYQLQSAAKTAKSAALAAIPVGKPVHYSALRKQIERFMSTDQMNICEMGNKWEYMSGITLRCHSKSRSVGWI